MENNNPFARYYESQFDNLKLENERNREIVKAVFKRMQDQNQKILEALKDSQYYLETAINATPTGAIRNILTEANIRALTAIQKAEINK